MFSRIILVSMIFVVVVAFVCTTASAAFNFTFAFDELGNGVLSDGVGHSSPITGLAMIPGWDGNLSPSGPPIGYSQTVAVPLQYDFTTGQVTSTALTEFLSAASVGFTTGGWVEVNDSNGISDWLKFAGTKLQVLSGTWSTGTSALDPGVGSELDLNGKSWGGTPPLGTVVAGVLTNPVGTVLNNGQPVQTSDVPVIESVLGVATYVPKSSGLTNERADSSHNVTTGFAGSGGPEYGFVGAANAGNTITYILTSLDNLSNGNAGTVPEPSAFITWSLLITLGGIFGYRRSRNTA